MQVLIVGGGGREHALAWKVAQSPGITQVFVAPGNAGTAQENRVQNVPVAADNIEALIEFCQHQSIDLTIVGPEAPLAAGIVDVFSAANFACFGPDKQAAQLEASKIFSKNFMKRHRIPTAQYASFTDFKAAKAYIQQQTMPIVIKADGLAAGKGVTIAQTKQEAIKAVENMLVGNVLAESGSCVVIEEFLQGEEASFIVMTDGEYILPLATSQDHKARDNGDKGPNTGGMGSYSPAPVITPKLYDRIMKEIIEPTINGMANDAMPYMGFLYAGLMITEQGDPKVLEFNCRLGDPEAQAIIMRMQCDFVELCQLALAKQLQHGQVHWDARTALGVVLTARGYPFQYEQGDEIVGLPRNQEDIKIFHAGTTLQNNKILTNGGRVLCVTALSDTIEKAQGKAYNAIRQINFPNMYYRTDIGHKAVAKELV